MPNLLTAFLPRLKAALRTMAGPLPTPAYERGWADFHRGKEDRCPFLQRDDAREWHQGKKDADQALDAMC